MIHLPREPVEPTPVEHPMIAKRDGTMVPFDRNKIQIALQKAGVDESTAHFIANDAKRARLGSVEAIQDFIELELMQQDPDSAKRFIIYRDSRTKARKRRQVTRGKLIADYIHVSKYAKQVGNRRESYRETCERNRDMHLRKYPQLADEIRQVYEDFVFTKRVLPSMRSMQFGGPAAESHNARMYNCSFSHADRTRFFSEMFYLLLCGCGVGYSVQTQHVAKLPVLNHISKERVRTCVIQDSIEGWADALETLMLSYTEVRNDYVEFIYGMIRPAGQPLVASGGKAPGHIPLKICLEKVRAMLDVAQGRKLRPIEIHDICCIVAEAVLSGGIRRSSLICLFSYDDAEMFMAKTGDWYTKTPWRAMANNSVVLKRDNRDHFDKIFQVVREWGEPGFFFTENLDFGTNPCGEIGLNPVLEDGTVGFAFCNLTEINGHLVQSESDLREAASAASFLGTLQAGYTDFRYLGEATRRLAERESLLGVGITGIMDRPATLLDPVALRSAAEVAVERNQHLSRELGISPASRVCTVKPSGTTSLLLEAIGSGIHPHHAKRYYRRVTANKMETAFKFFAEKNPHLVEAKPNGDFVIKFPIETTGITRDDLNEVEFLNHILTVYRSWVVPGTASQEFSPGLTHNVSCTLTVREDQWESVRDLVWMNRRDIAAMSFAPYVADKMYPFAPRETVDHEEEWNYLLDMTVDVDWSEFVTDDVVDFSEPACYGGTCEL